MKSLILAISLVFPGSYALACAQDGCTMHCTPGVSYACGQRCISVMNNCRQPTTSACNFPKPGGSSKPIFKSPTFVKAQPVVTTEPAK